MNILEFAREGMRVASQEVDDAIATAKKLESKLEAQELALSYAQDIVNSWPKMTIRTIGQMGAKVESLKQALEMLK